MLVADSVCRTDHIIWITLSPTSTVANSRYQHWCKIDKEWEILIFENQTLKNQNLEDALFALIAAPVDHELI